MYRFFSFRLFWPFVIFLIFILSFASRMVTPFRFNIFKSNAVSICLSSVIPSGSIHIFNKIPRDEIIRKYITDGDLISRKFIELVDVEGEPKLDQIFGMMTPEAALCNRSHEKDWIYMDSDREVMVKTEIVSLNIDEGESIVRLTNEDELIEMVLPYKEKIRAYMDDGDILEALKSVKITLVERNGKLMVRKFFAEQREEAVFTGRWK